MIAPRHQDDAPGVVAQLRQDYLGPSAVPRCEYGKRVGFGTYLLLDRLEDRLGRLPLLGDRRRGEWQRPRRSVNMAGSSVPWTICRDAENLSATATGFVVSDVSGITADGRRSRVP